MIREALDALDKATLGKWAVNESRAMVDSTDGLPICALAWPHAIRSEEETKANAALIAAAPEAIAWIKRVLPQIETDRDFYPEDSAEYAELDAMLKEARE